MKLKISKKSLSKFVSKDLDVRKDTYRVFFKNEYTLSANSLGWFSFYDIGVNPTESQHERQFSGNTKNQSYIHQYPNLYFVINCFKNAYTTCFDIMIFHNEEINFDQQKVMHFQARSDQMYVKRHYPYKDQTVLIIDIGKGYKLTPIYEVWIKNAFIDISANLGLGITSLEFRQNSLLGFE